MGCICTSDAHRKHLHPKPLTKEKSPDFELGSVEKGNAVVFKQRPLSIHSEVKPVKKTEMFPLAESASLSLNLYEFTGTTEKEESQLSD